MEQAKRKTIVLAIDVGTRSFKVDTSTSAEVTKKTFRHLEYSVRGDSVHTFFGEVLKMSISKTVNKNGRIGMYIWDRTCDRRMGILVTRCRRRYGRQRRLPALRKR